MFFDISFPQRALRLRLVFPDQKESSAIAEEGSGGRPLCLCSVSVQKTYLVLGK
jgi:hypothetical protein